MNFFVVFVYIVICLIWGSTWLAIKIGLEDLPPVFSASLRFLIASLVIYLIMKIKGYKLDLSKKAVKLYAYMILLSYAVPFAMVYWGEKYVASGLASVLFAVFPFFVAINTYLTLKDEQIGLFKILGMVAGFTGIVVIFWNNFGSTSDMNFWGMAAIVGSAFLQSFIAVMIKKDGANLNPLSMNFLPMLGSGIIMLIFSFFLEKISLSGLTFPSVASIIYLAVFGSVVTFTSYYWLIKKISIIILSLIAFITPIIALILGVLLYNEELLTNHLAGAGLVLAGLLIANFSSFKLSKK